MFHGILHGKIVVRDPGIYSAHNFKGKSQKSSKMPKFVMTNNGETYRLTS